MPFVKSSELMILFFTMVTVSVCVRDRMLQCLLQCQIMNTYHTPQGATPFIKHCRPASYPKPFHGDCLL